MVSRMRWDGWRRGAIVCAGVALMGAVASAQRESSAKASLGQTIYVASCAVCHGIDGSGGRGPTLRRPKYDRAPDDAALKKLIQEGLVTGEMPGSWWIGDSEIELLIRFLRSIGDVPRVELPGDPGHGKILYAEQNCAACHITGGVGSAYGPELTDIGARRNADFLRESIVRPQASAPLQFAMVYAVRQNGEVVEGIRLNEDSFTIQIRDANAAFHTFRKAELRSLRKQFGQTPMPSYADKLSDDDLDDLVAYMAALRGEE